MVNLGCELGLLHQVILIKVNFLGLFATLANGFERTLLKPVRIQVDCRYFSFVMKLKYAGQHFWANVVMLKCTTTQITFSDLPGKKEKAPTKQENPSSHEVKW